MRGRSQGDGPTKGGCPGNQAPAIASPIPMTDLDTQATGDSLATAPVILTPGSSGVSLTLRLILSEHLGRPGPLCSKYRILAFLAHSGNLELLKAYFISYRLRVIYVTAGRALEEAFKNCPHLSIHLLLVALSPGRYFPHPGGDYRPSLGLTQILGMNSISRPRRA